MGNKIPFMDDVQTRKNYAGVLSAAMGPSSKFSVIPATITPGLIVKETVPLNWAVRAAGNVERIYIMGRPESEERPELRGLGIFNYLKEDTVIYSGLRNQGFVTLSGKGGLPYCHRYMDTTEELLEGLVQLGELFTSSLGQR